MSWQYEHNRNKGMNSSEALKVSLMPSPENMAASKQAQAQRQGLESAKILLASQQQAALDQSVVDERASAYRAARRKQLAAANASANTTNLTGPSGLGDVSGGSAKTLLGA
jgi:hypothetical protein